jgi:peptidyl-tRNA hydrolase, PTH1 family
VSAAAARKEIIVVGLGNPGMKYAFHRHNLGFMVVDGLAAKAAASWTANREKTSICRADIDGDPVILVKPQTYMNLSGRAVAPIVRRENADPSAMVVIHDDLDLAPGRVRIKVGGGDGGHKGIRSIADSLRFRDFIRVRLGIGRPPPGLTAEEYVLERFPPEEWTLLEDLVKMGCLAVALILRHGVEHAQRAVHSPRKDGSDAASGA